MEDYQQDAPQKPSTKEPKPLLTFWRLIGFSALLSLLIAAGLWLCSYSRTNCDLAAFTDVNRAGAALERVGNEIVDMGLSVDQFGDAFVATNGLRYIVGPYYGWRGGTNGCYVLFRWANIHGEWTLQCAALRGTQPAGPGSRYVYTPVPAGGPDVPTLVMRGIVDARNGKSQDWNAYPYREKMEDPEICYTESIVHRTKKPPNGETFELRVPGGVPCDHVTGYAW